MAAFSKPLNRGKVFTWEVATRFCDRFLSVVCIYTKRIYLGQSQQFHKKEEAAMLRQ